VKVPGIHHYVAGSISAVTLRDYTKENRKCSSEQPKKKRKEHAGKWKKCKSCVIEERKFRYCPRKGRKCGQGMIWRTNMLAICSRKYRKCRWWV
jgi:hypothetical protein